MLARREPDMNCGTKCRVGGDAHIPDTNADGWK